MSISFENAFQSQINGFSGPARKHHFVGSRPKQPGYLPAGFVNGFFGLQAKHVRTGCGIAKMDAKIGQHCV